MEEVKNLEENKATEPTPNEKGIDRQPEGKVDYEKLYNDLNSKFEQLLTALTPKTEPQEVQAVEHTKTEEEVIDFDTYCYEHFDKKKEKK